MRRCNQQTQLPSCPFHPQALLRKAGLGTPKSLLEPDDFQGKILRQVPELSRVKRSSTRTYGLWLSLASLGALVLPLPLPPDGDGGGPRGCAELPPAGTVRFGDAACPWLCCDLTPHRKRRTEGTPHTGSRGPTLPEGPKGGCGSN